MGCIETSNLSIKEKSILKKENHLKFNKHSIPRIKDVIIIIIKHFNPIF